MLSVSTAKIENLSHNMAPMQEHLKNHFIQNYRLSILPKVERTPHSAHTSRDSPTLPEFISTPLGAIKIPLPTTVPIMKQTAGSRPILRLRWTSSLSFAVSATISVLDFPIVQGLCPSFQKVQKTPNHCVAKQPFQSWGKCKAPAHSFLTYTSVILQQSIAYV